jgi:GMP synthase-like glutamine amidotransferase
MRVVERVPWMSPPLDSVALHVTHQDQGVRPPDGAVVLVSSDFCPASALAYPDRQAISFQGHPEHTTAFARDLIEMKRRHGVEAAVAERAHASLAIPTDESTVGEWVLRFMETTGETTGESNGESNGESGG